MQLPLDDVSILVVFRMSTLWSALITTNRQSSRLNRSVGVNAEPLCPFRVAAVTHPAVSVLLSHRIHLCHVDWEVRVFGVSEYRYRYDRNSSDMSSW